MKLFITALLLFTMTVSSAFADCDFSTGIKQLPDGNYEYTKECHIKVGTMKKDLDAANVQLDSYQKAITLKDLALTDAQKRIDLWQTNSFALEDRITSIDKLEKKDNVLYFVLGIFVAGGAVWSAAQLTKH